MAVTHRELEQQAVRTPLEAADEAILIQVPARNRAKRRRTHRTQDAQLIPVGYEQLALLTTSPTRLGSSLGRVPAAATRFVINVESQALRYCDSETPTTSYGELWQPGTAFQRAVVDLSAVQLVATVAGAIANVSYYGEID